MSLFTRFRWFAAVACLAPAVAFSQSFPDAVEIVGPGMAHTDVDFGDIDGDGDIDIVTADFDVSSLNGSLITIIRANPTGYDQPEVLPGTLQRPRKVLFGDLDGDNDLDVVNCASDTGTGSIQVRFNDGTGTFGMPLFASSDTFAALTCDVGDADGDGDLDILVGDTTNSGSRPGIFALLNDGNGVFPTRTVISDTTSGSFRANDLKFAELTGDNRLDVVFTDSSVSPPRLAYYANSASGFGAIQVISTTIDIPQRLLAADLNADTNIDLVVTNRRSNEPALFFANQGSGVFAAPQPIGSVTGAVVLNAAIGDVDGDSDIDVGLQIFTSTSTYRYDVYPNNGNGTFAAPVTVADQLTRTDLLQTGFDALALPDLQLDGRADVLYGEKGGGLIMHEAQVPTTAPVFGAASPVLRTVPGAVRVITADIDGDNDDDLVAAGINTPRVVSWFENRGANGFGPQQVIADELSANAAPLVVGLAAADVNGDTLTDVLAGSNTDQILALFTRNVTGAFDPIQVVDTGESFQSLEIVDINGDTNPDILAAAGSIRWYPGQGNGSFNTPVTISTAVNLPIDALSADFDLDSDPDVVSFSINDNKLAWYANDGSGTFAAQQIIATRTSSAPADLAIADLNDDGRSDVIALWGDANNSVLEWYPNNLNGAVTEFGVPNTIATGAAFNRPRALKLTDVDDDGDLDVITAEDRTTNILLFRNLGAGVFDPTPQNLQSSAVAFDVETVRQGADALPELVWPSNKRNSITVATNVLERDFGDAPDPTFATLRASNGARHIVSSLFLGTAIDADADGQPNATATGDDVDAATNDEDGVTLTDFAFEATQPKLDVVVSQANVGQVNAWLDGNQDGDFDDTGEQIVTDELIENLSESIAFSLPATTLSGDTILRVRLSSVGGDAVDGQAADGEVEDYQVTLAAPTLSILDASLAEGDGAPNSFIDVPVQLSAPISSPVSVQFATSDGTATTADGDYTATTNTLTIPANTRTVNASIELGGDTVFEGNETFTVTLSNPSANATLDRSVATATITNDDPSPVVTLSQVGDPIDENGGVATVTATLANASDQPVTIDLNVAGTASASDYTVSATQITIAAGDLTGSVTVTGVDDMDAEGNETVVVSIATVTGGAAGTPDSATITITDDELPVVTLSQAGSPVAEDGGTATLTATLSRAFTQAVTVDLTFTGSAVAADFSASATQIVIPSGSLTGTATITGQDDTIFEGTETVIATISAAQNAVIGAQDSASVDIADDDTAPVVSLAQTGSPIAENGGVAAITASLSNASAQAVTIDLSAAGTASAADYSLSATQIVVAAGNLTGTASVTGVDDNLSEGEETVIVSLANVTGGTAGTPDSVTITITDDEFPLVNLSQTGSPIAEDGGQATVTATLSRAFTQTVTVNLAFSGTAAASDFSPRATQIVITAGGTTGSITLTAQSDAIFEGTETIVTSIDSAQNGTPGPQDSVSVDIADDDDAPVVTLSADPLSINEDGGISTVTATLTNPSSSNVTVQLAASGSATAADYTLSATQLVVAAGALTATASVTGIDDATFEADETVVLDIDSVTGGVEGTTGQVNITLVDDEPPPTVDLTTSVATVNENAGTTDIVATLSFASPVETTVPLRIAGGASASDYSLSATEIRIPAGDLSASITLTGTDDSLDEPRELVLVRLGALSGAQPGTARSVEVAIIDDDPTPAEQTPRDRSSAVLDRTVARGTQRIAVASFGLRNDTTADAQLESISVPLPSVVGQPPEVEAVELYLDANGDGELDAGDGLIGSLTSISNEAANFALNSPLAIASGATRRFLIIVDLEPVTNAVTVSAAD